MLTVINDLITKQAVTTHFQAIVSVKKRSVVGVEALSRGLDGPVRLHSPQQLFSWAQDANLLPELDDLCISTALRNFSAIPKFRNELLLFLNLDLSRLGQGQLSPMTVQRAVNAAGLRPQDVVLELSDLGSANIAGLRVLVEACQSFGFAVALSDLDGSPGSLRHVALLKPDIVKADATLISGLSRDPVRQQLLRSICTLARLHGGLTVGLGVETEDDATACLDQGCDLLQGYLFGRPDAAPKLSLISAQTAAERSAAKTKAVAGTRAQMRKRENERHLQLLDRILLAMAKSRSDRFEADLAGFVNAIASLECLYVLDQAGVQATSTVVWQHKKEEARSLLFAPAPLGADHSLKDYYLGLSLSELPRFVSEPYVSLATGNLCRTLAARFTDTEGAGFILCMDIRSA